MTLLTEKEFNSIAGEKTVSVAEALVRNGIIHKPNIGIASIKKVIFNRPATIVFWSDGTKTVVKCMDEDSFSEEVGLAMCCAKKLFGNKGKFNDVFKKWIPRYIRDTSEKKEEMQDNYGE